MLMCLASMVTMSRAGLVIAMAGAVLMLVLQSRHVMGRPWRAVLYALVPPLAYGIVNFSSGNRFAHTFSDLEHSATSPSVIDRRALLEGSLRMLKHHPFGDIGLGNFYYFYPAFRAQSDMSDGFFAHIDPLQLTLETGFPVTVLLYAFLIAVLVRTIRAWRRMPADSMARTVMAGAFVALTSLIVHSHINYNLYMPGILIPAGVLLGIWYVASEKAEGMDKRIVVTVPPRRRGLAACAFVIVLFTAALWPLRAGISSYYINRANALIARGDDADAGAILDRVARYGIRENFSIYEAQGRMTLQLLNGPAGRDPETRAETIRHGLAYMQEARKHNPAFSTFMSLEAQFYFLGNGTVFPDGLALAQPLLEQAVAANPLDVDAREGLSIDYQAQGKPQEALRVLNEGLNWPRAKGRPDIDFLMITARAHEATGDHDGAKLLSDTAQQRAQAYGLPLRP
jgi:tetratricopeptide (TPR) repeat protein